MSIDERQRRTRDGLVDPDFEFFEAQLDVNRRALLRRPERFAKTKTLVEVD
jgi:hypothetical protein